MRLIGEAPKQPQANCDPEKRLLSLAVQKTERTEITGNLNLPLRNHSDHQVSETEAALSKDYGMNSGIPFIKIANRVEVNVALKGERVSGLPLVFKQ